MLERIKMVAMLTGKKTTGQAPKPLSVYLYSGQQVLKIKNINFEHFVEKSSQSWDCNNM